MSILKNRGKWRLQTAVFMGTVFLIFLYLVPQGYAATWGDVLNDYDTYQSQYQNPTDSIWIEKVCSNNYKIWRRYITNPDQISYESVHYSSSWVDDGNNGSNYIFLCYGGFSVIYDSTLCYNWTSGGACGYIMPTIQRITQQEYIYTCGGGYNYSESVIGNNNCTVILQDCLGAWSQYPHGFSNDCPAVPADYNWGGDPSLCITNDVLLKNYTVTTANCTYDNMVTRIFDTDGSYALNVPINYDCQACVPVGAQFDWSDPGYMMIDKDNEVEDSNQQVCFYYDVSDSTAPNPSYIPLPQNGYGADLSSSGSGTIIAVPQGSCGACQLSQVNIATPVATPMHISAAPAMPTVTFHADIPANVVLSTVTFSWSIEMSFTQNGRDDHHSIPLSGTTDIIGIGDWVPDWGDLIAGGDVQVHVTASSAGCNVAADVGGYQIKGTNPARADVNSRLGGFPATNIACWESGFTLAQFNSNSWPLFGAPNGWGIMQIDNPPAACPLTESVIWNWRTNVDMGLCVIDAKRGEASASISNVYNSYPEAPEFPSTVTINGSDYDAFTIDVIKRYNGGKYFGYNPDTEEWEIVNSGDNPGYVNNVINASCN